MPPGEWIQVLLTIWQKTATRSLNGVRITLTLGVDSSQSYTVSCMLSDWQHWPPEVETIFTSGVINSDYLAWQPLLTRKAGYFLTSNDITIKCGNED